MFLSLAKDNSVINAKRWNDRFYDGLLQGGIEIIHLSSGIFLRLCGHRLKVMPGHKKGAAGAAPFGVFWGGRGRKALHSSRLSWTGSIMRRKTARTGSWTQR